MPPLPFVRSGGPALVLTRVFFPLCPISLFPLFSRRKFTTSYKICRDFPLTTLPSYQVFFWRVVNIFNVVHREILQTRGKLALFYNSFFLSKKCWWNFPRPPTFPGNLVSMCPIIIKSETNDTSNWEKNNKGVSRESEPARNDAAPAPAPAVNFKCGSGSGSGSLL